MICPVCQTIIDIKDRDYEGCCPDCLEPIEDDDNQEEEETTENNNEEDEQWSYL